MLSRNSPQSKVTRDKVTTGSCPFVDLELTLLLSLTGMFLSRPTCMSSVTNEMEMKRNFTELILRLHYWRGVR